MPTLKTDITWLHLSDFHLQASLGWSQDIVLDTLLKDIRAQYGVARTPDLLFITGDVAFSGRSDEYAKAEEFIGELRTATSVPQERLFIVPGNHDINRDLEEDAFRGAQAALQNAVEVDKFFASEGRRKTLFRREEAFRTFVNRVARPDNGGYSSTSFAHSKQIAVGPINVGVLLLDSAWLADGGLADTGTLLVGERQVIDAGATLGQGLIFGLVHHPFAWLREFEQIPIENLALERVRIMLRGHVHSADIRSVEALERRLIFFTAGATFETRTADNTYSWSTVDLATGVGTTVIHRYIHATKRWQANAPQTWTLIQSAPPLDIKDAVEFSTKSGGRFGYYRAALLAGHTTQTPRITKTEPVLLSFEIELQDDENEVGTLIRKLRNLFFWRNVWSRDEWATEADRLAEELECTLRRVESTSIEAEKFLNELEQQCRKNAEVIIGHPQPTGAPVFDQLADLILLGHWVQVREVIDRWSSQNLLTRPEQKDLDRIGVRASLELSYLEDAKAKIRSILEGDGPNSSDFYLAATVFYVAKDYRKAGEYMNKAIDNNIDIDQVRELALLIAGQTGDRGLRERVMQI